MGGRLGGRVYAVYWLVVFLLAGFVLLRQGGREEVAASARDSRHPRPPASRARRPAAPTEFPALAPLEAREDGRGLEVPILMYQGVGEPRGASPRARSWVGADAFERQVRAIAESGVATLTMDDVAAAMRDGQDFPGGAVAITFDEALAGQYEIAFPILRRYGVRATVYVPTGRVGHPGYATWDQLREMAAGGLVAIGAHTVTQESLVAVSTQRARVEISGSKRALERELRLPVRHLSYPHGDWNDAVVEIVRRARFLTAVTNDPGLVHDPGRAFQLGRYPVRSSWRGEYLVGLARRGGDWEPVDV